MPQESFRSVVYRSFVTCDDPKGVAEDATVRKSKTDSMKMDGKIKTESQRQPKTLIWSSSSCKKGEKDKELEDNPSSFQLLEVKKGAQKLNQVIDSWSKGVSFEGQSKDIAKDFLRGALDLKESLAMFGKLQEASHYMARLKKKQKPRISVDGYSRDCYEELRDVIQDSLRRQNLLPIGSYEQRVYQDRRKVEQSSDMPSTSSSRSSVSYSYEFASSDSFSSKLPPEKSAGKGSNLIAKLMGLETRVFENGMAQSWKPREDFPPKIKKVSSGIMHEQETFNKKLRKGKGGGDFKERVIKTEDEKVKFTGKSCSTKVKVSASPSPKPQAKVPIEKKVDKIQKLAPCRKKPLEMDNVKPSIIQKPREQAKVTISKETLSNSEKSRQISPHKTRPTSPIQKSTSDCKSSNGRKIGKIEKRVSKCLATTVEKNICESDDNQNDNACENESNLTVTDVAPAVQILDSEKTDELSDTDAYRAAVLQRIKFHDSETANSKLIYDCANELLECKNILQIPAIHPLLKNRMIKSRFCISVDQLTRDVSEGLENLSGYCKCMNAVPRANTIQGMLERDLWWKGDVGGSWDLGWRDGFGLKEVEEIVGDLDKRVLSELIENVLSEIIC